ncbi:MAG: 3-methyladenine DNA glycosylase [Actinomycetales bacterium]|nr:MAG: 3-methyladenine DNA glycosylase [Actinomycetales bacterium]
MSGTVEVTRSWTTPRPLQLSAVLVAFRRGAKDPTYRAGADGSVVRGIRTPDGPASLLLRVRTADSTVSAQAWGPGAQWAVEYAPDLIGEHDDSTGFVAHHRVVAAAARRFAGWRVPCSRLVLDALVPAVIEQRVTGAEAFGAQRRLMHRYGDRAPGPWGSAGLVVAPDAQRWQAIPSWEWLRAGVDGARSATVQRVCRSADAVQRLAHPTLDNSARATVVEPASDARSRLQAIQGVGAWTAAEVAQRALGDADAVSFGDYHVARSIGWVLAGVELDDDGLAELLEPYAGHRFRVQRLLELAGLGHPRRGPRMPVPTHVPTRVK